MKQLLFILALVFTIQAKAQVTLEHSYDGFGTIGHLEFQDDKYAILETANNRCRLYNENHSLYKTINLPVPAGYTLNGLQYVTDGLFNTDNLIEISYTYYIQSGSSYVYENRVANENGQILVTITGASSVLVDFFEDSWKYIAWIYDYSSYPYQIDTRYYSLPGQLITSNSNTKFSENRLKSPYPNPASDFITLSYKLTGRIDGTMLISNAEGQIVRQIDLGPDFENVMVPIAGLPAGIYFYNTEGGEGNGKFIVRN